MTPRPFRAINRPDNTAKGTVGTTVVRIPIPHPPQSGIYQLLVTAMPANTGPVYIVPQNNDIAPVTPAVPGAAFGAIPILPNSAQSFSVEPGTREIAAIGEAAGQVIFVTTGQGV